MNGGFKLTLPEKTTLKKLLLGLKKGLASHIRILFLFQPYCSDLSASNFAGTYFALIFRNIRKLIFENNTRFFIRDVFIRKSLGIVKIKKLSTNMTMLRFAPHVKNITVGKQFFFRVRTKSILLRGAFRSCQTSKMAFELLTISVKRSILDV